MRKQTFQLERNKRELEFQKRREADVKRQKELEQLMQKEADDAAESEMIKERVCKKCQLKFTRRSNREGLCKHMGKWHNWGVDPKTGLKKEWIYQWSCCSSTDYESQCFRSGRHEEA